MKNILTRVLAMLLLLGMVACLFACKNEEPAPQETLETADSDEIKLPFKKENYQKELTMLYYTSTLYRDYHFEDVTEAGDVMKQSLTDRRLMVEDYLGVYVVGKAESSSEISVFNAVQRDALAGIDQYQVALTHCYLGVTGLVTSNLIRDLYELPDISFNEDYWRMDAIEALEVAGCAYFGSSDFLISDVVAILYNKEMYTDYEITEDPYDLVRDGKWTMEKLMQFSSLVAENNGDDAWTKEDTYGFAARADYEFLSFIDACDVEWLTGSANKTLNMGPNNERYQAVYDKIEELADADWSYLYNFGDNENKVTISDGRFLFSMEPLRHARNHLDSEVKFGVLPVPKFNEEQDDYKSCDFGGMFCVPNAAKDIEMIGKTLECLSAYSADTVNVAYYERLLGRRVAEAADDAEMLDTYIFGKITFNPAYNYSEKANMPLGILVYTIPKMLRAKLNNTQIDTIAVTWAANKIAAQNIIDITINKK